MTSLVFKQLFTASYDDNQDPTGPRGIIQFSAMAPRPTWSGSSTTTSATIAPNGDACNLWSDSGASCLQYDLTSIVGTGSFTLGFYVNPTSYQSQYGNSPPQAWVMQVGPYGGTYVGHVIMAGTGTATYPKTSSIQGNVNAASGPIPLPVGNWHHVGMSYDVITNQLSGFIDGVPYGPVQANNPANRMMYIGGIGDRGGATAGAQTRYGYRGLISMVRYELVARKQQFDPSTWK